MADVFVNVITPPVSIDFLTLDEAKLLMGLPPGPGATDANLQFYITVGSSTIMQYCHRMFAKETVEETWRELAHPRIYLTHYPVKAADIESVYAGEVLIDPGDWEFEEMSGKLGWFGAPWQEPITIVYTGGYLLPDEAPPDLKNAVVLLGRDQYTTYKRATLGNVKSIAHKESRIQYIENTVPTGGGNTSSGAAVPPSVAGLLYRYMRFPV